MSKQLQLQIQKALDSTGGVVRYDELLSAALAGHVHLWSRKNSVILGAIQHNTLVFHLAAGRLKDVLILLEEAYSWARDQGVERAVFVGRRGWSKALQYHGWEVRNRLLLYERSL